MTFYVDISQKAEFSLNEQIFLEINYQSTSHFSFPGKKMNNKFNW